jgi:hypothetical protein
VIASHTRTALATDSTRVRTYRVTYVDALVGVCRPRAMRAAEEVSADLDTVSNDLALAVLAE